MFYDNLISTHNTTEKEFNFNLFDENPKSKTSENYLDIGQSKIKFNIITSDKSIKSGYGFKDIAMPQSEEDIDSEVPISIRGTEVRAIWKLKWYYSVEDSDRYYLFYFNNENYICYDNLFSIRYATLIVPTEFETVPYVVNYKHNGSEGLLVSGEGGDSMIISGNGVETGTGSPQIISCCSHYGMMFAITAQARGTLIYSEDMDILEWTDEKTKDLDFSDERGDLTKIISFNDYIYIFRDHGITEVSVYGSDDDFSISHQYLSSGFIYPNTIAECGESVYFLEDFSLKEFNGSSVKNIELECLNMLKGRDNRKSYATCFNGKYFLACNMNFNDNQEIGCEANENGFINNALVIYDLESKHVEIVRGIDINQLLALINPNKSKLVACFNNDYIGKIGELTEDGKIFGTQEQACWTSGKIDFDKAGEKKKIKEFTIKTKYDCQVEFSFDGKKKIYNVKASEKVQRVQVNLSGKEFQISIKSNSQVEISDFNVKVIFKK